MTGAYSFQAGAGRVTASWVGSHILERSFQPVPGDSVVGYVTRGRGVSIHRADCPNLLMLDLEPERRLDIDWKELEGERFMVRLVLDATDRRGLYADLAAAVSINSLSFNVARVVGKKLGVDPKSVEAQVIGEHGTSQVYLWSTAHVAGTAIAADDRVHGADGVVHGKPERRGRQRFAAHQLGQQFQ